MELRERAVKLVIHVREEATSKRGAISSVADQLDVNRETLRNWVLCRHRHNTHYADLRIMPSWGVDWRLRSRCGRFWANGAQKSRTMKEVAPVDFDSVRASPAEPPL